MVEGSAELSRRLARVAAQVPEEVSAALNDGAWELHRYMVSNYLSGQRLRRITGKLASGWNVRPMVRTALASTVGGGGGGSTGSVVGAILSTATVYAPTHEYGFDGIEHVREHLVDVNPERAKRRRKREASRRKRVSGELARRGWKARLPRKAKPRVGPRTNWVASGTSWANEAAARRRTSRYRDLGSSTTTYVRRAHTRHMRLKARHYARDTVRNAGPQALALVRARLRRLLDARG